MVMLRYRFQLTTELLAAAVDAGWSLTRLYIAKIPANWRRRRSIYVVLKRDGDIVVIRLADHPSEQYPQDDQRHFAVLVPEEYDPSMPPWLDEYQKVLNRLQTVPS